jgi:hypothetical protein
MDSIDNFNYDNTEIKQFGGIKIVRKVSIKKGKGHKSITKYRGGKKYTKVQKSLKKEHIKMIKNGKFITGLFDDCKSCNKTRKRKQN